MAISFRHYGTTCRVILASRCLLIDQASQPQQRIHRYPRTLFEHHRLAARRIQHPTRNNDSQIIFKLDNDRRFLSRPQPANDLYFPIEEGVEPIDDPIRTELMSSVLVRAATVSPRTCWRTGPNWW